MIVMKNGKETKPKIKEYSCVQDYLDGVLDKTYKIVKDGASKIKDKKNQWDADYILSKSSVDYFGDMSYGWKHMLIKTPCAWVDVRIDQDKEKAKVELNVEGLRPHNLADVKNLGIYTELTKSLKTGLEPYKHVKVAYK